MSMNVGLWHKADVSLAAQMSVSDPQRTFEAQHVRFLATNYYVSRQSARKVRKV
jgi:hypothetical protein